MLIYLKQVKEKCRWDQDSERWWVLFHFLIQQIITTNQEPEAIKVKIIVSEEPKKFCSLVHYCLFVAEEMVAMVSI